MSEFEILLMFIFRPGVTCAMLYITFILASIFAYAKLLQWGFGKSMRIFYTSLVLYLGPVMLLPLMFMRRGKVK